MKRPSRWRWSNIPVPEVYMALLVTGTAAHFFLPLEMFSAAWMGHVAGWPVLAAGVSVAAWAVSAAAEMDIAKPAAVITSGPYRFSRNPMYLGWAVINLGIGLIANSGWIVMLLAGALLFLHVVTVPREEQSLEKRFGQSYLTYKGNVRRWL